MQRKDSEINKLKLTPIEFRIIIILDLYHMDDFAMKPYVFLVASILALATSFTALAQSTAVQERPRMEKKKPPETPRQYGNNKPVAQIPDVPGWGANGRPNFGGCDAYDVTVGTPGCGGGSTLGPDSLPKVCNDPDAENTGEKGDCKYDMCDDPNSPNYQKPGDCPCPEGDVEDDVTGECVKPSPDPIPDPPLISAPSPDPSPGQLRIGTTVEMYQRGHKRLGGRRTYLVDVNFNDSGTAKIGKVPANRWKETHILFSVGSYVQSWSSNSGKGMLSKALNFPPERETCVLDRHCFWDPDDYGCDGAEDEYLMCIERVNSQPPNPMALFANQHTFQWSGACSSNGPVCRLAIGKNINQDYTATLTIHNRASGQVVLQKSVTVKAYATPSGGGGGGGGGRGACQDVKCYIQ